MAAIQYININEFMDIQNQQFCGVSSKNGEAIITARRLMKQKALSLSDIATMICWEKMTKRRSINGSSMEDQKKRNVSRSHRE
jgi:hypothetical protein